MQILLHNRRGRSWNEQKLAQIKTIAQQSLPDPQATVAQNIAINHYIQLLKSYQTFKIKWNQQPRVSLHTICLSQFLA